MILKLIYFKFTKLQLHYKHVIANIFKIQVSIEIVLKHILVYHKCLSVFSSNTLTIIMKLLIKIYLSPT